MQLGYMSIKPSNAVQSSNLNDHWSAVVNTLLVQWDMFNCNFILILLIIDAMQQETGRDIMK